MRKRPPLRLTDKRRAVKADDHTKKAEVGAAQPLAHLFNDRRKSKIGEGKHLI